jgi:peptidoglycan/LPS O-acetylase OafA/YrhL
VYVWHQTFRERAVVNAALAVGCVAAGILTLTSAIAHVGDFGRVFLFSGLVLGAATLDATKLRGFAARLSWLGDSTYSLYLLHIPVLLVTILALDLLGFDRYGLAGEEWLFVAYVCLMLALARLSYRYFELPCRRWLRKRLASGPRAEAPSGALAVGSD